MEEERIDVPAKAPLEVWLAGAVMVALMAWGGWQAFRALEHPDLSDVPNSFADIRSGVASDKFSKHLDNHLPARSALIATANAGRYLVFQGAGDSVRLGRDEWLFSVEELAYSPQSMAQLSKRVAQVGALAAALDQRGIKLVVALVPDKARVHAANLASGQYPHWQASRYATALNQIRANGVPVVDLLDVLARPDQLPMFYRTDTHWNQTGADQAAKAIADRVRQMLPDIPTVQFETRVASETVTRPGDLLGQMGLSHVPDWARPDTDVEAVRHTVRTSAAAARGGLFDDASVPTVLVGTSYSRRANFHGALQQHLSAEVLNVATDGGGFFKSMHAYLQDEAFATAPPSVIIWELPERVLSEPDKDGEAKGLLPGG